MAIKNKIGMTKEEYFKMSNLAHEYAIQFSAAELVSRYESFIAGYEANYKITKNKKNGNSN